MDTITRWTLAAGEVLNLRDEADFERRAAGRAVLVSGEARSTLAWNSWLPAAVWMPLRGGARLAGHEYRIELGPEQVWVAEHGSRLTVQGTGASGLLIGLLLPAEVLRGEALRARSGALDEPLLFPALVRDEPALQLPLLRLARAATGAALQAPGDAAADVVAAALLRQAALEPLLARCPGRSARYRRQLLLRLLRARNHIDVWHGQDAALARLAAIARLSPTHFLRLFQAVFGQTPHKYVVQVRLAAARSLLARGGHSVSEVCRVLGFENRCAFARVFRQHYGETPSQVRRLAAGARAQPARGAAQLLAFEPRAEG